MSASTTPHDWRRHVVAEIEINIKVMQADMVESRHIADAQRCVRRLRGELEGRVHQPAYPYVFN